MSPSTTERVRALVGVLILGACRLGGPSGDPTLPAYDGSVAGSAGQAGNGNGAAAGQAGNGGSSGGGGGGNSGEPDGASADTSSDAAYDVASEGGVDSDARSPDGPTGTDGASDDAAPDNGPPTACLPPFTSDVCDPVCNTGCPALFRCDTADTPRAGVCVGTLLSTVTEGMACTRTALTDDCVERLSCVDGICRRLCYRDTDCASGTCCTVAIEIDGGSSGFSRCTPCAP